MLCFVPQFYLALGRPSVVHPEVPKRRRRRLWADAVDRLPEVTGIDHCRGTVVVDQWRPDQMPVGSYCRDSVRPSGFLITQNVAV
jgi:hypothetical protein